MKKALPFLFIAIILCVCVHQNISAQQKHALVIGNGNYTGISRLANPVNDANDMETALRNLGFTVEKVLNGNLEQMETAVLNLKRRLSVSRNTYGFFFFAGHGVQSSGENYLIPVVADNIRTETQLRDRAVSLQFVLDSLSEAGNELNMIVLDACRDNPFGWARSGSRGLSVASRAPSGSIVMYATGANSTAADGTGRNGLFTNHLLNNLRTPGLSVFEVFDKTMGNVINETNGTQHPELSLRFAGATSAFLGTRPQQTTGTQTTNTTTVTQPVQTIPEDRIIFVREVIRNSPVFVREAIKKSPADSIVGVGSARMATQGQSRTIATVRAREEISRQIIAIVSDAFRDYAAVLGSFSTNDVKLFEETMAKTLTSSELTGARVVDFDYTNDNTCWVIVSFNKNNVLQEINNAMNVARLAVPAMASLQSIPTDKNVNSNIALFVRGVIRNSPVFVREAIRNSPVDSMVGVGSARMATQAQSRTIATVRAREEISRQIIAIVRDAFLDYSAALSSFSNNDVKLFEETIAITLSRSELTGSRVVDFDYANDNTCWVIVSFNNNNVLQEINNAMAVARVAVPSMASFKFNF
ncbi:MAG: caspase family protein [Treponema sp.]|nr:caspase family protein [Treponema sp.]